MQVEAVTMLLLTSICPYMYSAKYMYRQAISSYVGVVRTPRNLVVCAILGFTLVHVHVPWESPPLCFG